jgi:uncharacterized membrane protein
MRPELERLEALIGKILIIGVTIAGSIVAAGGALYLLRHGGESVHYHVFAGEPTDLRTIGGVIEDSARVSGRAIIQLGLFVLVAMQAVRVALTAWLFKRTNDPVFTYISVLVLVVLGYSLFGPG